MNLLLHGLGSAQLQNYRPHPHVV